MIVGQYPATRLRRLRSSAWIRNLVNETNLRQQDLIWPVFIREDSAPAEIKGMPGVTRLTITQLLEAAAKADRLGISTIALFPFTPLDLRNPEGREAINENNLICRAVRALKTLKLDIGIMTDVALDPYTTHGHDGVIINEQINNDATIEILKQQALIKTVTL